MDDNTRTRRTLKMWVRVSLALIISIGIFLPLLGIYLNLITVKIKNNNKIYTATINKNSNYKVYLFDNTFVNETEMNEGQVYIADLVKNIKFNFMYTYSGTKDSNLNYTYYINGKLYGENTNSTSDNNEVVWQKDYTILDKVSKDNNTSGFNITENIDLDYQKYKDEVNNFKKQFGMSLTTKLKLTMNVDINGKYKDKKINKTDKIILEIPVGVQAFSIAQDYKKTDSINLYKEEKQLSSKNPLYTNICLVILIISIITFLITFKPIFNIKPKSNYTKELNKILKTYGQIIVEVKTKVKDKDYNVMIVKNFDEMVDLEEELRIPIIMYENIYNYTSIFTITHNDTIYKYILKN